MSRSALRIAPLFLLALAFLAPSAQAQFGSFEMTSIVEKLSTPPGCYPGATHKVKCTDIYLVAGQGVDLSQWEGKTVDLKGALQLALCFVLRVDEIQAAPHYLRIAPAPLNQTRVGDLMTWRTQAPFLAVVPFVFGGPARIPLPVPGFGTLQLDAFSLYVHGFNVSALGFALELIRVPNDPALVGVTFYNQGAYADVSNPSSPVLKLLNVDCFTLKAR